MLYATGAVKGATFPTHSGLLQRLAGWGFRTPPWLRLCVDIQAVLAAIDELEALRHTFPFEIDGAVVKVNRRDLYERLGSTAKSPRWARAFKYEPERAETRIWKITVQVGRTGVLTPVAELEPVLLAGSEIARATLHNADEIARKDIRVGDRVWVVKAGDVIPAIESVLTEKRSGEECAFTMPETCPECGGPVARQSEEVAHRCINPACPAQRVCRLQHFASRDALDIRAIGGKVAEALVAQELVQDPLDLFALTLPQLEAFRIGDETSGTRRFGKNAQTALEALDAARTLPLDRWLFATGIPNVGVTVAEQIAAAHARFSDLAASPILHAVLRLAELYDEAAAVNPRSTLNRPKDDAERDARQARFNRVCGEIGVTGDQLVAAGVAAKTPGSALPPLYSSVIKTEAARSVLAYFSSDYGQRYLARLRELGIDPQAKARPQRAADAPLAGMTFVLTGTLTQPRALTAEQIKAAGGIVQDAVTKQTRYLVAGENVGATKISKARSLGTTVIDEAGLLALLAGTASAANAPDTPRAAPKAADVPLATPYQQQELF
ncbi:MAG: DNA ligase [Verrucomicrobia bacterium ADurb.Bin070]|nr:MAG: DNA ligase [Verrucomicrobia bacterium ADurb.Bin070]